MIRLRINGLVVEPKPGEFRTVAIMAAILKATDVERSDGLVAEDAWNLYVKVAYAPDAEIEVI